MAYFFDARANPRPTKPPNTSAAPPATATPVIVSLSIFFRMCSCSGVSDKKSNRVIEWNSAFEMQTLPLMWLPVGYLVQFAEKLCRTLALSNTVWGVHFQWLNNKHNRDSLRNVFLLNLLTTRFPAKENQTKWIPVFAMKINTTTNLLNIGWKITTHQTVCVFELCLVIQLTFFHLSSVVLFEFLEFFLKMQLKINAFDFMWEKWDVKVLVSLHFIRRHWNAHVYALFINCLH